MRLEQVFAEHKRACQTIPYITLGLLPESALISLVDFFVKNDVNVIEFGIPFSDPIADGPIIQQASNIALNTGFTLEASFKTIQTIRHRFPKLRICLMLYANSAFSFGLNDFYYHAKVAGVDGILIPDCPSIEAEPFIKIAKQYQIAQILFATAHCPTWELRYIAEQASGFVYCVSRAGVTGISQKLNLNSLSPMIKALKTFDAPPLVCGFGIQSQQDCTKARRLGCQGVIVGSKLLSYLIQLEGSLDEKIDRLKQGFLELLSPALEAV